MKSGFEKHVPPMGLKATSVSDGRQGFFLWGSGLFHDLRLVGGNYYEASYIAIFDGAPGVSEGIRQIFTAELVHEPWNPNDPNAVSVYVRGLMIGYMPRDDAAYFGPMVGAVRNAGFAALCGIQLWFRETQTDKYVEIPNRYWDAEVDDDEPETVSVAVEGETMPQYSCGGQLSLQDQHAIYPINGTPRGDYVLLPPGRTINVYDVNPTTESQRELMELSHETDLAAYATLAVESDGRRDRAIVNIEGSPIGRLSIPMSKDFVPWIRQELGRCSAVAAELHISEGSCFINSRRPFESGLASLPYDEWVNPHEKLPVVDDINLRQYPERFVHKRWSEEKGRYVVV
ncbi:HIRAN domain-containing protein [Paenarthrobacter sp. NPDC089989]|uniref:HIRAN domain-containing protein n=1 Tax=unclassified Paenarthrobacter TaxID=2634190 RepID=UPI0038071C5D